MAIPIDEVKVFSIPFHLITGDDLKENEGIYGDCDTAQERIRIATDEDISVRQMKITLCHEVEHKINALAGLDESDTEHEVQTRGLALYTFIRDNPELVAWIGGFKITKE